MSSETTPQQTYPLAAWRVIIHRPADGAANMAIDETIAGSVREGRVPPTLRFYSWEPGTLSLGYGQHVRDVDFERLAERGWGIVRRNTGGRSILHIDEMTYSAVLPLTDPRVRGGVVESYRRLSRGLIAGLERLGAAIHSEPAEAEARGFKGPVCFEVPSDYEITADGRKLVGSAQTRRGDVLLQHGTLPLYGDITRICDVLAFPTEEEREVARSRVRERAITLEEALGVRMSMARTVGQMMAGFASALNLRLEEAQLTPAEEARAEELRATKYATDEWLHRR